MFYARNSAAGIASATVAAAVIQLGFAAAAIAHSTATMDPNHHDGNDNNDPEGLIATTEQTVAPAVIATITSVHGRYLLD